MSKDKAITNNQLRITNRKAITNYESSITDEDESPNSNIPDLRFPEFEKDGEWEIQEVGEIFQVTRGYVLSMTLVKELPTEEYPYPVFSSQTKNNGLAGYYNEYLHEDAITWTTDGANAGDVNYRDGKFYCTNVCGVLLNEEGFANLCIAELINSVSKKHVSYVGNPKLMNGVMSKIQIPVPSIPEQQKIAACLSSLDDLLAAHNDKLAALKDHKKGLLQHLFPNSITNYESSITDEDDPFVIRNLPKLRFPEFEGDGEWVETKLNEIADIKRGAASNHLNYVNQDHPKAIRLLRINDFLNNQAVFVEDTEDMKRFRVVKDDILIAGTGATAGITFMVPERFHNLSYSYNAPRIRVTDCDKVFVYQFLKSDNIITQQRQMFVGNAQPFLDTKAIGNFLLSIPKNLLEQQKIASCISAVDELITAQQEKIEHLQQHKKGLMQGLFPKSITN